jgi:hypothetical protein
VAVECHGGYGLTDRSDGHVRGGALHTAQPYNPDVGLGMHEALTAVAAASAPPFSAGVTSGGLFPPEYNPSSTSGPAQGDIVMAQPLDGSLPVQGAAPLSQEVRPAAAPPPSAYLAGTTTAQPTLPRCRRGCGCGWRQGLTGPQAAAAAAVWGVAEPGGAAAAAAAAARAVGCNRGVSVAVVGAALLTAGLLALIDLAALHRCTPLSGCQGVFMEDVRR